MSDAIDPVIRAISALRKIGINPEPFGDDFERWRIGDFQMSDADVLRLAERCVPRVEPADVPPVVFATSTGSGERLDPVDALKHIRVVIEAASDGADGIPMESTVQEIRALLDRALGLQAQQRKPEPGR